MTGGAWWGKYIGIPYTVAHCWQLVRLVYADRLGVVLPSYGEVSHEKLIEVARTMHTGAAQECWQPVTDPQELDVCLLRGRSAVWHVGVMTDPRHVLHTERATDAVRVPIDSIHIRGRVQGFRRYVSD